MFAVYTASIGSALVLTAAATHYKYADGNTG